jgi:hypothetical protein
MDRKNSNLKPLKETCTSCDDQVMQKEVEMLLVQPASLYRTCLFAPTNSIKN